MGVHDQAIAAAQRALALATASGDVVLHALTNQSLGNVYQAQGDYRRAIDCFEQTMAFLDKRSSCLNGPWASLRRRTSRPSWMAAALGMAYTLGGRATDAVLLLAQAMAQATAMGRVDYQDICRLSLGEAQMLSGRLEEAHALAERALALACEHQERGHQAYTR